MAASRHKRALHHRLAGGKSNLRPTDDLAAVIDPLGLTVERGLPPQSSQILHFPVAVEEGMRSSADGGVAYDLVKVVHGVSACVCVVSQRSEILGLAVHPQDGVGTRDDLPCSGF